MIFYLVLLILTSNFLETRQMSPKFFLTALGSKCLARKNIPGVYTPWEAESAVSSFPVYSSYAMLLSMYKYHSLSF